MGDTPLSAARILIVDDEQANVRLLERILQQTGYQSVRGVTDPRMVVALYLQEQPDLVLLDLHMPYLDGFGVLAALTPLIPPETYLPILVLTADVSQEAKQRALALGAKDFLTKPFVHLEVVLRIKNLLETRWLHRHLADQNRLLEERVRARTAELRQAVVQTQRHLDRLSALRSIDIAITASLDLRVTLSVVLDQVINQLGVHGADVLLLNQSTQVLEHAAGRGMRGRAVTRSQLRLGEGLAGRAALERCTLSIPDLATTEERFIRSQMRDEESIAAYFAVPLVANGQTKGVLELWHRSPLDPAPEWLEFLEALAGQTALAIDNSTLFSDLQRSNSELVLAYDTTLEGWSRALDLRDKETEGHSQRVTTQTLALAQAMGLSNAELVQVRRGALLHDIGKMGIPDGILLKQGPLTEEEWIVMSKHPTYAYELLVPIAYLRSALDIPYCHHEKWDGSGYPRGLAGEQIPLAARLFAIVDVYDALTSDRPYRAAWSVERTRAHLQSLAGSHFEPAVVEAFLRLQDEEPNLH